jgi:hypothetical protein
MLKVTNKTWMWVGVGAAIYIVADYMMRRKQRNQPNTSGGGGSTPLPPPSASTSLAELKTKYVGRQAFAVSADTNVRKEPVVNNGVYNNIVGVLTKGELAGTIGDVVVGKDGKVWYYVSRTKDNKYSCPYMTCGVSIYNYWIGYVRSDVVNVVV